MPTPHLGLVPLSADQSQKHVTVNEALARLDAAAQLAVLDRTRTTAPLNPQNGDRYLIASPATGEWSTHEDDIAAWDAAVQGWLFLSPKDGWQIWVIAERLTLSHDGAAWSPSAPTQLGINTASDAINRLAVASDAVLLSHDGAGIQAKLNKAATTDTASILFQSDYTGHAEIGLTGGTDLHVKTSPDGITFTDALTVNAATGHTTLPAGATASGLVLAPEIAANILPDQGRFAGESANDTHQAFSYVAPGYLTEFNSSTLTDHAQFIHNNTTYGGLAGPLDAEIDALISLVRNPAHRRFGIEWWAIKITKGSGSAAGMTVGNTTRHPALRAINAPMPAAYTVGFYVRALSGSAFVDQDFTNRFARWGVDETGNLAAGVVTPADGWVFIERQMTSTPFGYNAEAFQVYLENTGDEALFALPRVVFGHMHLDPYLPGPLPNSRFFG